MKGLCFLICLLLGPLSASALEVPSGGAALQDGSGLSVSMNKSVGTAESLESGGQRVVVNHPDSAKANGVLLTAKCHGPLLKGEAVLAVIKARTVGGTQPGSMIAKLQISKPPYTALAPTTEFAVPLEWTELPVTFVLNADEPSGDVVVQWQCGHKQQTLEIESVQLQRYPVGLSTRDFPRIKRTYPGREADAPWRKQALQRIEQQRKVELGLQILGPNGEPLRNAEARVDLRRHQFGFGSAVTAKLLASDSEDAKRYKEIVERYFSVVVFENDLKDGNWAPHLAESRKTLRNEQLDSSFAWLQQRHIDVRGHYLMQVATPYNFHDIQDNRLIRDWVMTSVKERMEFVKDRVYEWDVINHPVAWEGADMLTQRAGLERLDQEVYQLARSATKLPFFVNEDQIFRPGKQHDETLHYIRALQEKGFDVKGLGNQAHFSDSYLPSPEHLLAVTDDYAQVVPQQSITEFDVVTTGDEALAADFTRDALIATFSHPAYTSFLFWGFWEGSHWKPEAASWNKDWSIKGRGQVIEEWLGKNWHTSLTLQTDGEGHLQWRGFPGFYEIHLKEASKAVDLPREQPRSVVRF